MSFMYYNCIYRAEITLNIKELVIDVDVKINDLLPFCSKFPSWLLSAKMTLFMLVLPGLFTAERALGLPK